MTNNYCNIPKTNKDIAGIIAFSVAHNLAKTHDYKFLLNALGNDPDAKNIIDNCDYINLFSNMTPVQNVSGTIYYVIDDMIRRMNSDIDASTFGEMYTDYDIVMKNKQKYENKKMTQ